jgi:predicted adenylyl cyclase CyaB
MTLVRNVEIKTRLRDRAGVERALERLGATDAGPETQYDVFYRCPSGRLKLRESSRGGAALIHYERADAAIERVSDYEIVPVPDPAAMRAFLDRALGRSGEVRKERHLFLMDNVRIHLDRVEQLGHFLELEAIVDADHTEAQCRQSCARLLERLRIEPEDHLAVAYVDLPLE